MLTSDSAPDPQWLKDAAEKIGDTYFLESWGVNGGLVALTSRASHYADLALRTVEWLASLTPEQRAEIDAWDAACAKFRAVNARQGATLGEASA